MRARAPAALCGLLLALASPLRADEPSSPGAGDGPRIHIPEVRQVVELSGDRRGKAFALLGPVTFGVPDVFFVEAENVVIWLDPEADATIFDLLRGPADPRGEEGAAGGAAGDGSGGAGDEDGSDAEPEPEPEPERRTRVLPLWAVRGIYAEGGAVPATFQAAGRIFRCSALHYDVAAHRGTLVDAELRIRRRTPYPPLPDLVLRAERFRAVAPGEWRADDVTLFASDYQDPQVEIEVERVTLTDPGAAAALDRLVRIQRRDGGDGGGRHRRGRDGDGRGAGGPTAAEVEAVLADLRAAALDPESKHIRLDRVRGTFLDVPVFSWRTFEGDAADLVPLRIVVDAGSRGRLGTGGYLGVGMRTRPIGWLVGAGYFEDRGPLFDGELELRPDGGRVTGDTRIAYLHDHGDDNGIVPPSRDRYWLQNRYRARLTDVWRLDGEYTLLRDPEWLRTYDEREFKEGKDQESLFYLRGRGRTGYVTVLGKARTIDFQDEVEALPLATASLPVWTIARLGENGRGEPVALQLALDASVGNLRHRQGDAPGSLADFRVARADLDPTFFVPFDAGPVRVVPFTSLRVTGWDDDLAGDDAVRFAGTGGVRADVQLGRWYGNVLHVMNVSLTYEDLYTLTEPASLFFPLDDADRVTPYEAVYARWRHRLLRKTERGRREFFSAELLGAWFPDRQQPLGRTGDGYVELDLDWSPIEALLIGARAEVDTEEGRFDTGSAEAWWQATQRLGLGLGFRHLEGDSDIVTATAEIEVQTKWRIVVFSQHDFRNDASLDQGLLIQRIGRTAVVGARMAYDPGDGGFRISMKVDLTHAFRKKQRRRQDGNARSELGWR